MNSHPFWDFVNEMNNRQYDQSSGSGRHGGPPPAPPPPSGPNSQNPWETFGWGFPFGPMPHRGRPGEHHPPPPGPHGPPGAGHHHPPPPPPPAGPVDPPSRPATPPTPPEELPNYPGHGPPAHDRERSRSGSRSGSPPPPPPGDDNHPRRCGRGGHGRHGGERRGGRHGPGGRHGRPEPFEGPWGRGLPGFVPWGDRRHHRGGPPPHFNLNHMPQYWSQFQEQFPAFLNNVLGHDSNNNNNNRGGDDTFVPDVDVFNTTEAYVIHASVPGAKKGDMDVSYDSSANAIKISGVVQRPGEVDEEMLNTMVESQRRVGLFERTVYLDKEVRIDADGLTAKLEDGVLRVEVPKMMEEDWTEVKKVQVE